MSNKKNTTKINKIKNIGLLATMLAMPVTTELSAQSFPGTPQGFDASARVREDYSTDLNGAESFKTTIGFAKEGNYERSTPGFAQFFETSRVYDFRNITPTKEEHYLLAGLKVPELKLGDLSSKEFVSGAAFDRSGLGIESMNNIGIFGVDVVAETLHYKTNGADSSRVGGDFNVNFAKLEARVGFEHYDKNGVGTDQAFVTVIGRLSENNYLGATLLRRQTGELEENVVGISGLRFGKDAGIGGRFFSDYRWDNSGTYSTSGHLILASETTFRKPGIATMIGTRPTDNGQYGNEIAPIGAVSTFVDEILLYDRSDGGWAFGANWKVKDTTQNNTATTGGGFGYTIPSEIAGGKISFGLNANYNFDRSNGDYLTLTPQVAFRAFGKHKNIEAYLNAVFDSRKEKDTRLNVGLQYAF